MENIRFSLLGFGDSNYKSFCHSSKILERNLIRLKATKFIETVYNDDAIYNSEIINDWIDSIIDFFINHKSNVIKWFINSMNNHIID